MVSFSWSIVARVVVLRVLSQGLKPGFFCSIFGASQLAP
jgi:hypothetical protein